VEQQTELKTEVRHLSSLVKSVADNQMLCPARRKEILRIERRGEWKMIGKISMWAVGFAGGTFGVVKLILEIWG
jgi:hypothetical protein